MDKPIKPDELNGEHAQLWDMVWYLAHRVDGIQKLIIGFGTGILVALLAGWISLMAQL